VRITYDGDGNLAAKTVGGVTTRYLVDDLNPTDYSQVVEEIVNGQVQQQYTYGHTLVSQRRRLASGWAVSFYSMDGHGSVRQLTDLMGAVTDTYTYDAFGKLISRTGTTPNSYLYAGERFDADLGLYHLRARHYDADRGRFVSMDPYPGEIDDPVSLHKYLYANADPVNFVDPSGLESEEEAGIVRAIALRIVTSLWRVGRGVSCVLIQSASTIAGVLGYDEWVPVADLASRLLLPPSCLRYPPPSRTTTTVLSDVTVTSRGKVIGRGNVYLGDTIEGIRSGRITPREVFKNREGLLPSRPPDYYSEFDHPTPGINGRGPQRIVQGKGGDLYYTPDHYGSFIPLN
jgi:RHS repeat-associated protein